MSSITFSDFINLAKTAPDSNYGFVVSKGKLFLSPSGDKAINVRTWNVFKRAVYEYTQENKERVERIFTRYFSKLNIAGGGIFLNVTDLEAVGVGLADIQISDLEWQLAQERNSRKLEYFKPNEIKALRERANPIPFLKPMKPPQELRAGTQSPFDNFKPYDALVSDQRRLALYQPLKWHPHAFAERFAMAMVNCEMEEGTLIPVDYGDGNVDFYTVKRIIVYHGLYMVALSPTSAHSLLQPMVAFRQTQSSLASLDAIHTWLANLQKNAGETAYEEARKEIMRLMNDPEFCPPGKKVILTDYSLGNAFGGYFFRDHFEKISDAILFNCVCNGHVTVMQHEGVKKYRLADYIADHINQLPPDVYPPRIFVRWNKYDMANNSGECLFGHDLKHPLAFVQLIISTVGEDPGMNLLKWLRLHGTRTIDSNQKFPCEIYHNEACDPHIDNKKRGKEIYKWEQLRSSWVAVLLYYTISIVYELAFFIFNLLGIEFFRTSEAGNPLAKPRRIGSLTPTPTPYNSPMKKGF